MWFDREQLFVETIEELNISELRAEIKEIKDNLKRLENFDENNPLTRFYRMTYDFSNEKLNERLIYLLANNK